MYHSENGNLFPRMLSRTLNKRCIVQKLASLAKVSNLLFQVGHVCRIMINESSLDRIDLFNFKEKFYD